MPRTGTWTAPSPQKLADDPYQGRSRLQLKVRYVRQGRTVSSKYGNTVTSMGVLMRYFCPKGGSTVWSQNGFALEKPVTLSRTGSARVVLAPWASLGQHTLILHFKRTTFSGRLSGSVTTSDGAVCNASVSFSGRLKTS